jgi:nitrate reductase gamma subunit
MRKIPYSRAKAWQIWAPVGYLFRPYQIVRKRAR